MNVKDKVKIRVNADIYDAEVYKKELEADGSFWIGIRAKDTDGSVLLMLLVKELPCSASS